MNIKTQCLNELETGHLGMAVKLVEDNHLPIDGDLKKAAVDACIGSLKCHFHWIIPLFVSVFKIAKNPELNQFANKLIFKALQIKDYPLAVIVGQTFDIRVDNSIKEVAKEMIESMIKKQKQAEQLGAIVMSNDFHEYRFDLED